jgi:hypothetical protein
MEVDAHRRFFYYTKREAGHELLAVPEGVRAAVVLVQ